MPTIKIERIGYGMGTKDFEKANCCRAFMGESSGHRKCEHSENENSQDENSQCEHSQRKYSQDQHFEKVTELICNLDDMTPESISFAQQLLMDEGALDVYTTPIGMKKGRAGISLTCMCKPYDKDKMLSLIFKHTTTLGMREYVSNRYFLQKETHEAETPYGPIRVKISKGFGITKSKPEFDDIAKIANEQGISVRDVYQNNII